MNTLNLVAGGLYRGCRVYVDGRQINLKRGRDGRYVGSVQTDKSEVEVAVVKQSELYGSFWFLWAMLFFIISCFGIFNSHYDKRCVTVNCNLSVRLNAVTNLRLEGNNFIEGQRALSIWCDAPIWERANIFGVDRQAKKRFKILTLVEVLLWLALIATAIAIFITRFI